MYAIGLKLWSTNLSLMGAAERLYAEGIFAYLELFIVPGSGSTLEDWRRLHEKSGLPFIVHNAHAATGFNLADRAAEAANRTIYAETRRFADALDARYVIFHGGVEGTIEETARQLALLEEPRAVLENKPFEPLPNPIGARFCRGATTDEIAFVLSKTGCGFCLDVGHAVCAANSQGLNPYAFVGELANRFRPTLYHLSDLGDMSSVHDTHLHLGSGTLDIRRLCADVFPAAARISLETVRDSLTDLEDFRRDVACLCRSR